MLGWFSGAFRGLYRRRGEILFIGGSLALVYFGTRKLRSILLADQLETLQGDQDKQKLQTHFEVTQQTADESALKHLPRLKESIVRLANVEYYIDALKAKVGDKVQNWEELKYHLAFSKCMVSVYSICLLVAFTRVQMNLMAKYIYLQKKNSQDGSMIELEPEDQAHILGLASHILLRSPSELMDYIRLVVTEETKKHPLNKPLSHGELLSLFSAIRNGVEHGYTVQVRPAQAPDDESATEDISIHVGILGRLTHLLLPANITDRDGQDLATQKDQYGNPISIRFVEAEMTDIFESEGFVEIVQELLDQSFAILSRLLLEKVPGFSASESVPFAKLIPMLSNMIDEIFPKSQLNPYGFAFGAGIVPSEVFKTIAASESIKSLSVVSYADPTMLSHSKAY